MEVSPPQQTAFTITLVSTSTLLLSHLQTTRLHDCAMYEPHLVDLANQHSHGDHEGMSLLEELDKIAPIKSFDAFPKVQFFSFLSLNYQEKLVSSDAKYG